MKNKLKTILVILILSFTFSSCKKDIVENPNLTEYETDLQQFEAVWNGLNTAYVMWPIDTTNWDVVYKKYRPIFEAMEDKSDEEWWSAWRELTASLVDHHLAVYLERPSTKTKTILHPGWDEVRSRDYYHNKITIANKHTMLVRLELEGRLKQSKFDYLADTLLCSGILDEEIAYFYASTFLTSLNSKESFKQFKQLVTNENIKSAIIDLRDNQGGHAYNTNNLVSCFTTQQFCIGYNRSKTGLDRYDLGPKVPHIVGAGRINDLTFEGQDKDIPVIVLGNLYTASAAEISALAIKQLPQGYMVGERTWGATCSLVDDFNLFYSGSFGDSQMDGNRWVGHGHYIYTPKYLFTGIDGNYYEGIGVTSDKECLFDQLAWNNGIDNQLECAIAFAKEKANSTSSAILIHTKDEIQRDYILGAIEAKKVYLEDKRWERLLADSDIF